jgi:hypothetical protein
LVRRWQVGVRWYAVATGLPAVLALAAAALSYALPTLLDQRLPQAASLILGAVWGAWPLPTFLIRETPQYGRPLVAS